MMQNRQKAGLMNKGMMMRPYGKKIKIALTAGIIAGMFPGSLLMSQTSATGGVPNGSTAIASNATNSSSEPTLKLSPTTMLRQFEPAADEEYTIGAGDEIAVDFPARTELSTKGMVGPDGRMTLPLIGAVKLDNMTRDAAGKVVSEKMSAFYKDIEATVRVEKYGSNHVTVLGNLKTPGTFNFDQTPTLLEALSRGGIERRADGSLPEQCVIYRGEQVVWVDLEELVSTGSPLADLRLRRNDVIFVPSISMREVTVMGQVQHPGQVPLKHDATLATVLGDVGGPTDGAGSNPELQIVHRSKGNRTQYVHLKDILKPNGGMEVSLAPGDVIFVPKSGFAKMGFVMQQLAPFMTMASFAAIAH